LVAGGYFRDGAGPVQALTFLGWQSATATLPVKLSANPSLKLASVDFVNLQTTIVNPLPLAVAAGQINNDAHTDVLLLVGAPSGTTSFGYWITGGAPTVGLPSGPPLTGQFSTLPASATVVALGNLDSDPLPDAVFALNPGATQSGQVMVYLNQTALTAPVISWDQTKPITSPTKYAPSALAVADYNGDGVNDILYASLDGVHVLINQLSAGKPTFTDYLVYLAPSGGWGVSSLVAVDFSADSRPDVIVADGQNHAVLLLENSCTALP